jgi:2-iminobutanoate/2-iminopropanoate deaminase
MRIVNTPDAPQPIGPYSQAIEHGGLLYVSGQIALDSSTGRIVNTNIEQETEKVLFNLFAILNAEGLTQENVIKCSIFIRNMADFGAINQVYAKYFSNHSPARETVEVARLPKDVNIEVSCIAAY